MYSKLIDTYIKDLDERYIINLIEFEFMKWTNCLTYFINNLLPKF